MSVRWSVLAFLFFLEPFILAGMVRAQEPRSAVSPPAAAGGTAGPSAGTGAGSGAVAVTEPAAAAGPTQNGPKHPDTYLEFAIAGGPVMILLGICSIVWLAFLIERLVTTRRNRILPTALARGLKGPDAAEKVSRAKAEALCVANPSSAASILRAALDRLGLSRDQIELGVNNVARREIHFLRRNIRLFAIIASVAPLLGLLGTVTGLIRAFRQVAIQGLGQGQAYASGIYEALTNTAGGLMVAIPAFLTYYWLMGRVDRYVHEIDHLVTDFVDGNTGGAAA